MKKEKQPKIIPSPPGPLQRFISNPKYHKFNASIPREKSKEEIENGYLLYQKIKAVFSNVDRRDGISLHQTYAIDLYGSAAERDALKKLDTDKTWEDVKLEWIENFSDIGGLCFFDDIGFRYYTPVYFRWYLERGHLSDSNLNDFIIFHFTEENIDAPKMRRIFSPSQAQVIKEFLEFCLKYAPEQSFKAEDINLSISKLWGNFEEKL